jgi:hypothetical protein
LAYILFTSGSTGKPKGVYQTQRGLLHDVRQYLEAVRVRPHDRLSLLYSPGVNGAIRDIFGALLAGACLCLRDLRRHGIAGLDAWLEATGVTIYHSIPNIFRTMLAMRAQAGLGPLPLVRWVYLAGDRIFTSDYEAFRRFFPSGRLHVGIGATEAATIYRQWVLDGTEDIEDAFLPLGFAVPEREMTLIGADGLPVAVGEIGEICVRSAFVAQGYWRDDAQTAERFVDHGDGTRTYRTGDLGRLRPDGMLELVGRADRQVKIGGTRVEPAEVEAALLALPEVVRAAVLPQGEADARRLVAVVMLRAGLEKTGAALRAELAKILPPAFVPAEVQVWPELPLMHNFKTDLAAVRAQLSARSAVQVSQQDDGDLLAAAWWSRLGRADGRDPFLSWRDGGGDSIALANLHVQLEGMLVRPLPLGLMTLDLTLAKLRQWIADHNDWRATEPQTTPIALFPSLWGMSTNAQELVRKIRSSHEVMVMDAGALVAPDARAPMEAVWEQFQNRLLQQLAKPAPRLFLAHCHGGAIALRLLLENPDITPARLVILDPSAPSTSDPGWFEGSALFRPKFARPPKDRFAEWLLASSPSRPLPFDVQLAQTPNYDAIRTFPRFWQDRGAAWPPVDLTGPHADVLGPHNHEAIRAALGL